MDDEAEGETNGRWGLSMTTSNGWSGARNRIVRRPTR